MRPSPHSALHQQKEICTRRMVKEFGGEDVAMRDTPQAGLVLSGIYTQAAKPSAITHALRTLPQTPEGRKWLPKEARPPREKPHSELADGWEEPDQATAAGHFIWVPSHVTCVPKTPETPPEPLSHRRNGSSEKGNSTTAVVVMIMTHHWSVPLVI
jgi:hypothetical protein